MSSNLIGGFFNRLEASRKYLFGSMGVLGESNNSVISGALICRGQDIIPVVEVAPDYESYAFKKLDLENADDKAFFEAANAWDLAIDGKKWADGKNVRLCVSTRTPSTNVPAFSSSKRSLFIDVVLAVSIALLCLPRSSWSLRVLCSKLCQKAKRTGRCICAGVPWLKQHAPNTEWDAISGRVHDPDAVNPVREPPRDSAERSDKQEGAVEERAEYLVLWEGREEVDDPDVGLRVGARGRRREGRAQLDERREEVDALSASVSRSASQRTLWAHHKLREDEQHKRRAEVAARHAEGLRSRGRQRGARGL